MESGKKIFYIGEGRQQKKKILLFEGERSFNSIGEYSNEVGCLLNKRKGKGILVGA